MLTITSTENEVIVRSEYNALFIKAAKRLGGKWSPHCWHFDIREEEKVLKLCLKIYGTDGVTTDTVDVRLSFPDDYYTPRGPIYYLGRTVATAYGRDSGAKTGDGIVIESGGFSSGGSAKNWATTAEDGTVVLIRDLPRLAVEADIKKGVNVEIVPRKKPIDKKALLVEIEAMKKRSDEIRKWLED